MLEIKHRTLKVLITWHPCYADQHLLTRNFPGADDIEA